MSICRGFDPSAGHTIPISSRISMMRPARANQRPSFRWSIEVDAFCSLRISSIADSIILWIFIKTSTRYSTFKITTISKNNRRILKALQHTWINRKTYLTNNIVHFISCNEYSLHTISFSRTTWVIEHIPITEKILCSTTVKNGT